MAEVIEAKPKMTEASSNSNLIAGIAWLFAPIASLILVLLDNYKSDKFVQFHAWQSLAFGILMYIVSTLLSWTCIVPLAVFVFWIVGVVKAFQGEMWKVPGIGDWAEQQADKAVAGSTKKE